MKGDTSYTIARNVLFGAKVISVGILVGGIYI